MEEGIVWHRNLVRVLWRQRMGCVSQRRSEVVAVLALASCAASQSPRATSSISRLLGLNAIAPAQRADRQVNTSALMEQVGLPPVLQISCGSLQFVGALSEDPYTPLHNLLVYPLCSLSYASI